MSVSAPANPDTAASRYAWAEHLIWMEGGEPVVTSVRVPRWTGIALAVALSGIAFAIPTTLSAAGWGRAALVDPVLVGMLLGLAWGNFFGGERWLPGISVTVRRLLPIGIVLLGARMNFVEAMRVGLPGLALSLAVVAVAFLLLFLLGKVFRLEDKLACLLGVGTGICGGTAIVAIAPLLSARDRDVMLGVGLVTLLGLGAMLLLPPLGAWLGLSQSQFGLLAGLTIHQTPQVIAAGFTYGEEAGQVATIAKLARVCLLAPVAIAIGWWVARQPSTDGGMGGERSRKPWYRLLPGFALGFLLLAIARSLGLLPEISMDWDGLAGIGEASLFFPSSDLLKSASTFLVVVGMVGVGFQTRLSQARDIGWRPVAAAAVASLAIGGLVLAVIRFFFS